MSTQNNIAFPNAAIKHLSRTEAEDAFNTLKYIYMSDAITSRIRDGAQDNEQYRSMYAELKEHIDNDGPKPLGDCEDCAITWGEIGVIDFNLPRNQVLVVRGLSPQGQEMSKDVAIDMDHAWCWMGGWVFDIWEDGPVHATECQHWPYDFWAFDSPFDIKRWDFA